MNCDHCVKCSVCTTHTHTLYIVHWTTWAATAIVFKWFSITFIHAASLNHLLNGTHDIQTLTTPFNPNRQCPYMRVIERLCLYMCRSDRHTILFVLAPIFLSLLALSLSVFLCTLLSITIKIFNFGSGPYEYIGFVFYCHIHSKHELIPNMKWNEIVTAAARENSICR